jgi:hypothetical protein
MLDIVSISEMSYFSFSSIKDNLVVTDNLCNVI